MIMDDTILLVHNYQPKFVQDIADYIGDSLALCKIATKLPKVKNIIFAGVKFMAENAKILNPDKNIFITDSTATCPMVEMGTVEEINAAKRVYVFFDAL
jgi:quinolinate synthase